MKQWISEASESTFEQEVIQRSFSKVVLVDFWAGWCAPCRMLGPVLEAAVEARQGAVQLVKVDTDGNRELAVRYQIQGIPAVKAFVDGKVVDEFVGVQDRRAVDAFIDRVSPSAEESGLKQAEGLLEAGRADGVAAALAGALESPRHREQALLLLARARVQQGEFSQAKEALEQIAPRGVLADQVDALGVRIELLSAANGTDETAQRLRVKRHPDDLEARWVLAALLLAAGKAPEALEELLELLQRSRSYREDGARRAMLAIFDELGHHHDLAREYRRRMQVYL